jgi:hypothetical protein
MIPATRSHGILQENTRNRWNMEAVFRPEIVRIFFGGFLSNSCAFRQEPAGNHQKKSENFPVGILLPQNHRNYPEPAVSGPGCSTGYAVIHLIYFVILFTYKSHHLILLKRNKLIHGRTHIHIH